MTPTTTVADRRRSAAQQRWARAVAATVVVTTLLAPSSPASPAVADTTIATVAGTGTGAYAGDGGPAPAANLNGPVGLATDGSGATYVADTLNNRVRRIDTNGVITTVAGTGVAGASGDGGGATAATLRSPKGVAVDAAGNVFIADWANSRIRRVDTAGIITTVAGSSAGFGGDGGAATAAKLSTPAAVATTTDGGLLIADTANNRIRRVSAVGTIATVAGGGPGGLGDGGPATPAALSRPSGVVIDAAGGFWVVDAGGDRVRHVDASGTIATVAGGGNGLGDGGAATGAGLALSGTVVSPGLAVDPNGDIYIADTGAHRVRRVTPDGVILTLAGEGTAGFAGDGGSAAAARLQFPAGLAVPASGRVLVADTANNRIRAVQTPALAIDDVTVAEGDANLTTAVLTVTRRDNSGVLDVNYTTVDGTATVADSDYLPATGSVHFVAGQWRTTVPVKVVGDVDPELDQTFSVRLSGSGVSAVSGTVTIASDDPPVPEFSIGDTSVIEGDSGTAAATFTVTKMGATSREVSVDYHTVDRTAIAPGDYQPAVGTVRFSPQETSKTIAVEVASDEHPEVDKTFTLELAHPVDARFAVRAFVIPIPEKPENEVEVRPLDMATATIVDDDVPRWSTTAALNSCIPASDSCAARAFHTATRLWAAECVGAQAPAWCGRILAVGGSGPTAQLYDPSSATWAPTGSMLAGRYWHTATLLTDGRVLVVGGRGDTHSALQESETYDPRTGLWTVTSAPTVGRFRQNAELLNNGSVLVFGGTDAEESWPPMGIAEIFEPTTNTWQRCTTSDAHHGCPGPMTTPRVQPASVVLPDGRVLVAGGAGTNVANRASPPLASAETYDPASGQWQRVASMTLERWTPHAVALTTRPCGGLCDKVLVTGGGTTASSEIYDPASDTWSFGATPDFDPDVGVNLPHVPNPNQLDITASSALSQLEDGTLLYVNKQDGRVDFFDPVANRWQLGKPPPPALPARPGERTDALTGPFAAVPLDTPACQRPEPPHYCGAVLVTVGQAAFITKPGPAVTDLAAAHGPSAGGTQVVIRGRGFAGATGVKFGDAPAVSFRVDSPGQITAVAPSQPSGKVEVSVRTRYGGTSRHFPADLSVPFAYAVSQVPGAVNDLSARPASDTKATLSWSAPTSDGAFPPPAGRYVVKVSTTPITDDASFTGAASLCGGECSFNAPSIGSPLSLLVDGLHPGTTYHFALRAVNDADMSGPLSNRAEATTTGVGPSAPVGVVTTTTTPAPEPPPTTTTVAVAAPAAPAAPLGGAGAGTGQGPTDVAPTGAPSPAPAPSAAPSATPGALRAVVTTTAAAAKPPSPAPTTTTPGSESALGQSIAAPTRTAIPTWMWVVLAISVFANLAVVGALLSKRLNSPSRSHRSQPFGRSVRS